MFNASEWYRLVTACSQGDFIVLPYWKTWLLAPWPDIPHSHVILTQRQPVLALSHIKCQCDKLLVWFLFVYCFTFLATSKVISGGVLTCDSTHSWCLYSVVPLGDQATSTMSQSHYPDIEPSNPCAILIIPSTWLSSGKYQFDKSLAWLDQGSNPHLPYPRPVLYPFGHRASAWIRTPDLLHGKPALYWFGHCIQLNISGEYP